MFNALTHLKKWYSIPKICALCNQKHRHHYAICPTCQSHFTRLKNPCQRCSKPLPHDNFLLCGICLREKPQFDRVFTHYTYEEPLRTLIHEFKYLNSLYLRTFITQLMLDAYEPEIHQANVLIPIPIHPKRLRERGFNQSLELTKILSKRLKIPYDNTLCQKIINTDPQVGLSQSARQNNVRNAFMMTKRTHYHHVILVDDVMTTGSTANEVAKLLKNRGIQRVEVWCSARAI